MDSTKEKVSQKLSLVLHKVIREMTGAPDNGVNIEFMLGEKTIVFKINLNPEHRGRLIGSKGKNITALRDLVSAMSGSYGHRAVIDLVV
ncbi:KH domain-containing protein [Bdellovibrio svalbardensis]|uniref:KH domain-containing protein n=1 Tax=Bdellovibrio svalbardensis TaxID=2972972 RepID=A0ABT6DGF7_9BACT|nr:KH domain-containing protein [Bdellovibrio svalbardensis]MDG0815901.1 KH domain-containing protein [Bdellovibrio svalbardensis]